MRLDPSEVVQILHERGWIGLPRLSEAIAAKIQTSFDEVIRCSSECLEWAPLFNQKASVWKTDARNNGMQNSGYFGPYYRDVRGGGKDNKITYQTCESFRTMCRGGADVRRVLPPAVEALDTALLEGLGSVLPFFSCVVEALIDSVPELGSRFVLDDGSPNVSARVLKYFADERSSTNPHVDKSALTYIAHTSDGGTGGSLAFAKGQADQYSISDFRNPMEFGAPLSTHGHVFPGEALAATGLTSLRPTPHAALKMSGECTVRYSIVYFWLVRGVDLAPFDTKVVVIGDDEVLRDY